MRKGQIIFVILVLLISDLAHGQAKRNRYKYELCLNLGATEFLGELGGANQVGTHFVKDLNFSMTRPVGGLGLRYRPTSRFATKADFFIARVNGDDKLTSEPFRHNRNLNFRSNIFELSVRGEFYITKESQGHLYRIKNVKGMQHKDIQAYLFGGVGGFYFNPKGEYTNGQWYALRPLGTEGQGLPGGPKEYSLVSVCIPAGVGMKYGIDQKWSIGLEYGARYTFTDYIDDVSGKYYNNAAILHARGPIAAYFADPSIHSYPPDPNGTIPAGLHQTAAGNQRGDPKHTDAYMFMTVNVNYKIPYSRRTRSKF
ncbi:MAG TPA: DUF6089 family protein [Bacteroidia bacterium]|nr:DUF6089 family protein [Bacteroidia bacterium]